MKFKFTFTFLVLTLISNAQKNNGFFGKKAFVQLESVSSYPLFSNLFGNDGYAASGKSLFSKRDNFNIGFRTAIGYSVKRNLSLIFEYGQDYSSVYPPSYIYVTDPIYGGVNSVYTIHEMIDLKTSSFIPKIEFGSKNALLPMGLSHQIGFGVAYTKIVERDYLYKINDYSYSTGYINYSNSTTDVDPIDFKTFGSVRKFVILYALSMRSPITKSLMVNYGIRYTLNVGKPDYTSAEIINQFDKYDLKSAISRSRMYSFMSLNLGLTYAF